MHYLAAELAWPLLVTAADMTGERSAQLPCASTQQLKTCCAAARAHVHHLQMLHSICGSTEACPLTHTYPWLLVTICSWLLIRPTF